ncbi:Uncharacterised protein [Vibrio cholerae]|nr:Uncharacterised protein [Vibrio cholerae]
MWLGIRIVSRLWNPNNFTNLGNVNAVITGFGPPIGKHFFEMKLNDF